MKIEKAIEILKDPDSNMKGQLSPDFQDAIKLGIEALKRLKETRTYPSHVIQDTLIGETKD